MINPILFNTEMVCRILDGRKTVTRRVVKPQPVDTDDCKHEMQTYDRMLPEFYSGDYSCVCRKCGYGTQSNGESVFKPRYRKGDILYVRETWALQQGLFWHKAGLVLDKNGCDEYGCKAPTKWRHSIYMPKEAARIFLRVTNVRVERLQDITPEQAMKEGVISKENRPFILYEQVGQLEKYARNKMFPGLWDSTIKKTDRALYGWDANPWVWVIEFDRITREDAMKSS